MKKSLFASAAGMIVLASTLVCCTKDAGVAGTVSQDVQKAATPAVECAAEITVAKSSASPTGTLAPGAAGVRLLSLDISASSKCPATLRSLDVTGYGIRNVGVVSNGVQYGARLSGAGPSKATIVGLGLLIPAGTTKAVYLTGDIDPTVDFSTGIEIRNLSFDGLISSATGSFPITASVRVEKKGVTQ